MFFSYRTRRALQALGIAALVLVLAAVIVWMVWLLWLDRYVVYSRDGVRIDFSLSPKPAPGIAAEPPEVSETISIYYNEGNNTIQTTTELTQMVGFYADTAALSSDFNAVVEQIYTLPPGTPIMLDVKDINGRFFYSTGVGTTHVPGVDPRDMDELLDYLRTSGLYTIARLPAFRDKLYGLENVNDGLFHTSGRYLWMDEQRCYWLNPDSSGTMAYLIQIINELKALGFQEVVLSDFCFPKTDKLAYSGDKDASLQTAASTLMKNCGSETFTLSFCVTDPTFPLPEGRSRMYLADRIASEAAGLAAQTGLADPSIYLVFLTEANDTRFDAYSVLRPVSSAYFEEE